jgi:hypothetical protein
MTTSPPFADSTEFLGDVQLKQIIFLEVSPRFASIIACFTRQKRKPSQKWFAKCEKGTKESPKGMLLVRSVALTDGREHQQGLETTSRLTFGSRTIPRNVFCEAGELQKEIFDGVVRLICGFMLMTTVEFP